MNRERLTLPRIAGFACPSGKAQAFLWDIDMPRLAVRATVAGAKSFVFEGKLDRQTIRITIGDARVWTIDSARIEARRLQTVVDQGIDPRQQRADQLAAGKSRREAARQADEPALDVWKIYVDARRSKWSARSLADHESVSKEGGEPRKRGLRKGESETVQPGSLRRVLLRPLQQIDRDVVSEWLAEEVLRRPTHAALAYRLLRGFLNWCAQQKAHRSLVHAEACSADVTRAHLPKRKAKDDCLQREQLPAWFENVRKIQNPVIAAYLQIVLLTGGRREEIAGLKWTDVDFQWKSLRIADKVEGERSIPMTPHVESLLRGLRARNETPPSQPRKLRRGAGNDAKEWAPSAWVFSSPTAESGRLQEPRLQHQRACVAARIDDLTIHGLRRSFGTLAEWVECPAGIAAQIMGHKPSATAEKHYRRRPLDLLRKWHTKIEAWILDEGGVEQPKEDAPVLRVVATD
jgi:integrase